MSRISFVLGACFGKIFYEDMWNYLFYVMFVIRFKEQTSVTKCMFVIQIYCIAKGNRNLVTFGEVIQVLLY